MAYNKHIDKTEEALQDLRDVYNQDNVDRFLDGLEAGRINSEEQIIKFTNTIRQNDGIVLIEYTRLKKLKDEGFIEQFATNCNKRFSTCNMLMNKIRSTISRGLKTLEWFCEKRHCRGKSKSKRSVIENSKIGNVPYTPSYWGLEQYKDSVRVLYNEIVSYKSHLSECINLCLFINEQVAHARNHPKVAHRYHQDSRRKVLMNNRSVIKRFIDLNADMECEILEKVEKWKQEKKTIEEISAILYHTLDKNEYNDWIISEEVLEARREGITNQERALWGDNKQQVMRCRVAYAHIDDLNPKGQKDRIGGDFLAMLYKWSGTYCGTDLWLTYFTEYYKKSGGVLTPVKNGAVKRGMIKILKEDIDHHTIKEFNESMDKLIKKYMISGYNEEENMKRAVNF